MKTHRSGERKIMSNAKSAYGNSRAHGAQSMNSSAHIVCFPAIHLRRTNKKWLQWLIIIRKLKLVAIVTQMPNGFAARLLPASPSSIWSSRGIFMEMAAKTENEWCRNSWQFLVSTQKSMHGMWSKNRFFVNYLHAYVCNFYIVDTHIIYYIWDKFKLKPFT